MTDNQQHYPDSHGARWEGQTGSGHPGQTDRPAFLDRTEPMSRQDREARAGDPSLDDLMGGRNRTSRLPSQERGEAPTGGFAAQHGPETPQWSPDGAPVPPPHMGEPATGDPELAAVSRMEPPRQVPPPMPPQLGEAARGPMGQPSPPHPDLNEPTQMHNPVPSGPPMQQQQHQQHQQQQQQRGRAYPSQVSDGVYQSNKSGLGPVAWIAAFVMAVPIAYVMVRSLASGAGVSAGAVVAGVFGLTGLPLTAFGLQAVLNANREEPASPWRAPYVYLVLGLVLVLAAGMAAG